MLVPDCAVVGKGAVRMGGGGGMDAGEVGSDGWEARAEGGGGTQGGTDGHHGNRRPSALRLSCPRGRR